MIAANLVTLRADLPETVKLVAVSKTKPIADLKEAYNAGQRVFGENRIQEMAEKFEALPKDIEWHMIGHVQDNKMKFMASFVTMVHGMDKIKRLKALNKEAAKCDRMINCLIQVHIATEDTKFGFNEAEVLDLFGSDVESLYPNLRLCGLMGMATFTDDRSQIQKEFHGLSQLYSRLKEELFLKDYFDTLSMGMSGDYKLAISEGSTMIRVGSSIFGARH
jgi:pyridoxal phosphate enzyme (YggS family)